ncbi:hypothetical protein HYQ46_007381 [Verticillium longisporum]|nr:hypothetical protein HYQ46_007381 [Verticillium longisporum]
MVPLAQQAVRRVVRVSSRSVSSRLSSSRSASSASARSWTTSSPVPAKPVFPAVGWFVKGIWCPLPPKLGTPDNRNPWFDLVHSATQSKATFEKDVDSLVVDCWTDLARKVRLTRALRQLEDG